MAIPGSYYEVIQVLGSLYDEVEGCIFYDYVFPDNEKHGEIRNDYSCPNAIYLYQGGDVREGYAKRRMPGWM